MSKSLLVDYIPFEISRNQINESIKNNDGRLVVKAYYKEQNQKTKMVEFIQRIL